MSFQEKINQKAKTSEEIAKEVKRFDITEHEKELGTFLTDQGREERQKVASQKWISVDAGLRLYAEDQKERERLLTKISALQEYVRLLNLQKEERKQKLQAFFKTLKESQVKSKVVPRQWSEGFDACLEIISEVLLDEKKFEELLKNNVKT